MILHKALLEEIFFFSYHYKIDRFRCMKMPILERRFMINRLIEQKQNEKEEMEKQN